MEYDCAMKGFLSFLILWIVSKRSATGAEIGCEIEKRKGNHPSPALYTLLSRASQKRG